MSMTFADRFCDIIKEEAFEKATNSSGNINYSVFEVIVNELTDKKLNEMHDKISEMEAIFSKLPICKCSSWADVIDIENKKKTNNHHRKCEQYKEL